MAPGRLYTDDDVAKIRKLAAAGFIDTEIGERLGRSAASIASTRKRHSIPGGWTVTEKTAVSRTNGRKGLSGWQAQRKAKHNGHLQKKGAFSLSGWVIQPRAPGDLCGGRRLTGAEFKARKAELEARDRAERHR